MGMPLGVIVSTHWLSEEEVQAVFPYHSLITRVPQGGSVAYHKHDSIHVVGRVDKSYGEGYVKCSSIVLRGNNAEESEVPVESVINCLMEHQD